MAHPDDSTRLRLAAPGDVRSIMEIERTSFVHAGERFGERRVRYLLASRRCVALVAESKGAVLGWAVGFTWDRGATPWGRVYGLAVHPNARGKRLGPVLLGALMDALRDRGAGPIFLEVRPDNHAAIRLYEKFGFSRCRDLPNYYGPGLPAERMVTSPSPSASP